MTVSPDVLSILTPLPVLIPLFAAALTLVLGRRPNVVAAARDGIANASREAGIAWPRPTGAAAAASLPRVGDPILARGVVVELVHRRQHDPRSVWAQAAPKSVVIPGACAT